MSSLDVIAIVITLMLLALILGVVAKVVANIRHESKRRADFIRAVEAQLREGEND